MYYAVDNGDTEIYVETIEECFGIINGEWSDQVKDFKAEDDKEDAPTWSIFPIWMTEEEFKNLPDAY